MHLRLRVTTVALVIAFGGFACDNSKSDPAPTPAPAAASGAVAAKPAAAPEEAVKCEYGMCKVQLIGTATVAELEKTRDELAKTQQTLRLDFNENTTDEQFKTIEKVPWVRDVSLGMARKLTTLAPLAALKTLKSLYVGGNNNIKDIKPLAGMAELESLDIAMTGVSDLEPVKTMPKLRRLNLYACKAVTDLAPLANNATITWLNLYMVVPKDWAPVSTLANLEYLNVAFSELKDLSLVTKLSKLQEVDASWSKQLKDIKALAQLKGLLRLQCIDCPITDLKPLAGLKGMTSIGISGTAVADLKPISGMPALQMLDVQRSKVKSLDPAKKLAKLGAVYAAGTAVKDFKPLTASAEAKSLYYVLAPKGTPEAKLAMLTKANPQCKVDVEK